MNELQIFNSEEFGEIRTVTIDNEPWFVAKDVCEALKHTNPTMAMQMLEEDERTKLSLGRAGETNVINESGLYTLIIKSNLPNAKKLRNFACVGADCCDRCCRSRGHSRRRRLAA